MKRIFTLIIFIYFGLSVKSQNIFYGFPLEKTLLKKGDLVILNIPEYTDCRFNNINDFDCLIKFLNLNKHMNVKIEINVFYGDSILSKGCADVLCKDIERILDLKKVSKSYIINSNGNTNPIFLKGNNNTDRDLFLKYIKYNSRLEIIIE